MKELVICAAKYFLVDISTLQAQEFTGKVCNAVLTHKNLDFTHKSWIRSSSAMTCDPKSYLQFSMQYSVAKLPLDVHTRGLNFHTLYSPKLQWGKFSEPQEL